MSKSLLSCSHDEPPLPSNQSRESSAIVAPAAIHIHNNHQPPTVSYCKAYQCMFARTTLPLFAFFSLKLCLALAMSSSGASSVVGRFATKPCVQKALQNPSTPEAVLSFFFGADFSKSEEVEYDIRQGHCLHSMSSLWFGGGPEYDKLCQPLTDILQAAGRNELPNDPWETTLDGLMAQTVLLDQLSRNIFRGSKEAFAYDETALKKARIMTEAVLSKGQCTADLKGEFYPPYYSFMLVPFMHSENIQDHELGLKLVEFAKANTPEHLKGWWEYQTEFELDHKRVIDRFGRYPHRNAAKGRTSTPEELQWLAYVDNLPGWARSQM
jgi:uncharacterized protein (DUF924 family)